MSGNLDSILGSFLNFWLCWSPAVPAGFSLVVESGGFPLLCGRLTVVASLTAEQGSGRRGVSSCCTWAQQLWLPGLEGRLSNCGAHV